MDPSNVLAHQGGWDEAAFVAIPLILFAGLLVVAKRRAESLAEDDAPSTDDDTTEDA